jgi:uncharacterized membrane protein YfcA
MVSFFKALTPSIVGGILIGILSGIPLVNIFFPLFFIGGYFAAFLYEVLNDEEIDENGSVSVGFLAGFFGSFFGGLVLLIVAGFFSEIFFSAFKVFGENSSIIMLLSGFDVGVNLITLRNRFIFNLAACIAFGIIGGYLYAKRKRRKLQ